MDEQTVRTLLVEHSFGTWRPQRDWHEPGVVERAEGVYFYDKQGRPYLDFASQLMCSTLGHGNAAIVEAICRAATSLPYVAPSFACESKAEAIQAVLEVMPEGLDQLFFSTSGTEANEAALKITRQYMKSKGRYKIISRYRSYHGSTAGSVALTGDPRRWFAEPTGVMPGVVFAPDAYCYRCPFELSRATCQLQCAEYVRYMIEEEGNVAAIFVEPVVGTNGVIVPPEGYFQRLRAIADEYGVLLVVDEVMSGWFRTGPCFAIENWGVTPDILTTAKGCTGAYTPVGLTVTRRSIRDHFENEFFAHGHTYSMHPLAVAAIPAAVSEYKRIVASGAPSVASHRLEHGLSGLKDKHKCVGDVRGMGHFWAIELVKNRRTKEPFNTKSDKADLKPLAVSKLAAMMMRSGVHVGSWYNHFIIAPPLTIREEEIDEGISVIDDVLEVADEMIKS